MDFFKKSRQEKKIKTPLSIVSVDFILMDETTLYCGVKIDEDAFNFLDHHAVSVALVKLFNKSMKQFSREFV